MLRGTVFIRGVKKNAYCSEFSQAYICSVRKKGHYFPTERDREREREEKTGREGGSALRSTILICIRKERQKHYGSEGFRAVPARPSSKSSMVAR